MGLTEYWHIARRRWLIIAVMTSLGIAAAVHYASNSPPAYQATSRVYIGMATGTSVNDSYQGGLAAQQRVTSYANLVSSANIAERVIADTGLPLSVGELRSKIDATFPPATSVLDITVTDSDPGRAKLLADSVVAHFRALVGELETTVKGAAPAAQVTVVDLAETPTTPTSPGMSRLVGIGLFGGLALGCLTALLRDRLDRRIRSSAVLARTVSVPTLAIIDVGKPGAPGETQRLRARLRKVMGDNGAKSVHVTSFSARSQPDVAIGLSHAMADAGRKVALVDANTSGNGSSARLPAQPDLGLADLLRTSCPVFEALTTWPDSDVGMLALGAADNHTCDLLSSQRFEDILASLQTKYDVIIVETAPVASAADALFVSHLCDATIAVVELRKTTVPEVRGAEATFEQGGDGLVGVVAISQPVGFFGRVINGLRP